MIVTYQRTDVSVPARAILFTVPEACGYLRISRWSLYKLINRGQLETITIGRRRLVPATALYKLVEQSAHEARP